MTKFESFRELADSWKNNTSSAIIYASGDDKVILTYHNLYEQITEAPSSAEVIRTDHSPRTVVRIFADVIGGNDILCALAEFAVLLMVPGVAYADSGA